MGLEIPRPPKQSAGALVSDDAQPSALVREYTQKHAELLARAQKLVDDIQGLLSEREKLALISRRILRESAHRLAESPGDAHSLSKLELLLDIQSGGFERARAMHDGFDAVLSMINQLEHEGLLEEVYRHLTALHAIDVVKVARLSDRGESYVNAMK